MICGHCGFVTTLPVETGELRVLYGFTSADTGLRFLSSLYQFHASPVRATDDY
jgi:hypothetical protein